MIDTAIAEIEPLVGTLAACVPRFGRLARRALPQAPPGAGAGSPPAPFSATERAAVLEQLNSERFVDASPAEVSATLLDEGRYLAAERTMYRLLAAAGLVRERRDQLTHPPCQRPELLAEAPNQVWSWDITKLFGPSK